MRCTNHYGFLSSMAPNFPSKILGVGFSSSSNIQMTDAGVPAGVRILALNNLRDNDGARKKVLPVLKLIMFDDFSKTSGLFG